MGFIQIWEPWLFLEQYQASNSFNKSITFPAPRSPPLRCPSRCSISHQADMTVEQLFWKFNLVKLFLCNFLTWWIIRYQSISVTSNQGISRTKMIKQNCSKLHFNSKAIAIKLSVLLSPKARDKKCWPSCRSARGQFMIVSDVYTRPGNSATIL